MHRSSQPSASRENEIRRRQDRPGWHRDYIPGQLATREEAPKFSRFSQIDYPWLGRRLHVMSEQERDCLYVGLASGLVVDLHEGRMLPPEPGLGPLHNCPHAQGEASPSHRGTLAIAQELNVLQMHPMVRVPKPNAPGETFCVAYPLLGDLLWYFRIDGRVRPINWTVKAKPEDFEIPPSFRGKLRAKPQPAALNWHRARQDIERILYEEVEVSTKRAAGSAIPSVLSNNLRRLHIGAVENWRLENPEDGSAPQQPISKPLRAHIVRVFKKRMDQDRPVFITLRELVETLGRDVNTYRHVLYSAIWHRELLVDLWSTISPDQPLRHARKDLLNEYAEWFRP